jgi:hypothetical protein
MRTPLLKTKSPKRTGKANGESTFESGANQHKPAKRMRNRVPPPQRERILQKYVTGKKSIKDISKEEGRNRETVAKIVRGPEMQEYVRTMRERWFGLGTDAMSAVEHALTEQKDGRLGFQLLASIGVIPSPEERRSLAIPLTETESDEQAELKRITGLFLENMIERAAFYRYREPILEEDLRKAGGRANYETGKIEPLKKETAT